MPCGQREEGRNPDRCGEHALLSAHALSERAAVLPLHHALKAPTYPLCYWWCHGIADSMVTKAVYTIGLP